MLGNSASGPEIGLPGLILAGLPPGKNRNRPFGGQEGRCRCFPGSSPAKIRPGRPIYGPEALLCNIDHYNDKPSCFVQFEDLPDVGAFHP
jgi:hypothetical protein